RLFFFFTSRRRHTRFSRDWSSDVCSSDLDRAYLDMKYTPGHPLGLEWAAFVELRDSYDWDPARLVAGLPESAVEGVSAAVWTERSAERRVGKGGSWRRPAAGRTRRADSQL